MSVVSPEFHEAWLSGQHIGAKRPVQQAWVRTGFMHHHYDVWDGPAVGARISADAHAGFPFQSTWTPTGPWIELPGILEVTYEQDLADNGLTSATIIADNILRREQTGVAGLFHTLEKGGLAPFRGYEAPLRPDDGLTTNEWQMLLASKVQILIKQGYGDETAVGTFTGLTDSVDMTSSPTRMTIAARDFGGPTLAEQRMFGTVKDPQIKQPVTFVDSLGADDLHPRGRTPTAKSTTAPHTPDLVLDHDSGTYWESDMRGSSDAREWIEISVPQGRYASIYTWPEWAGMNMKLSIYVAPRDDGRDCQWNGVAIPSGQWLDLTGPQPLTIPIPDGGPPIEVPLTVTEAGNITSVQVALWARHEWSSDLVFTLIHPDGTEIDIIQYGVGGYGGSIGRATDPLILDATGTYPISWWGDYGNDVLGTWQPDNPFDPLIGKPKAGVWKLRVYDRYDGGDTGTLDGFALAFDGAAASLPVPSGVGVTDGVPYIQEWDNLPGGGAYHQLGDEQHPPQPNEIKMGDGSKFRLTFTDLHNTGGGNYAAGVKRFVAIERIRQATALRNHWILVDDAADVVRELLRWAGFKEWEVEDTGVRIKRPFVVSAGDFLIDIIKQICDTTGFTFFIKDPTDNDLSIGVPVFRKSAAWTDDAATITLSDSSVVPVEVTDEDLLVGIQVKWDEGPLAYIIRVRGKADTEDGAALIGYGNGTQRINATYRPPWYTRLAGIFKHVVHTDELYTTPEDCLLGCYIIALNEALESVKGSIEIPAHPGVELDQMIGFRDEGTGSNTRMWISNRHVTMHSGQNASWKASIGGSMVDTPDVIAVKEQINSVVAGGE